MTEITRREFLKTSGAVVAGGVLAANGLLPDQALAANNEKPAQGAGDVISLPKGGGAIRGIGETFQPNLFSGTANFSVPIATSPGRGGFSPELTLQYSSGQGNGPFGLGWALSVPQVSRKTEKGLPRYTNEDIFLLSGAEDLIERTDRPPRNEGNFRITTYLPRIEGLFARIEKWERIGGNSVPQLNNVFWKITTKDNNTNLYGRTPQAVLANPDAPGKIFQWLLELSYDTRGNYIHYEYKQEDGADVSNEIYEQNRRHYQIYLKRVRYGNLKPLEYASANAIENLLTNPVTDDRHFFTVVFDYGEHGENDSFHEEITSDIHTETKHWAVRPDSFSSFRAGFEIRNHRQCKRVLMFHNIIPGETGPVLVKSTDFFYKQNDDTLVSILAGVTQRGYKKVSDPIPASLPDFQSEEIALGEPGVTSRVYEIKSIPRLDFGYTEFRPKEQRFKTFQAKGRDMPPKGLNDPNFALVDLFGTGLPDVLQTTPNGYYFWRNLGDGMFDRRQALKNLPTGVTLDQKGVGFGDMAGDGQADLLVHAGQSWGYYEATNDGGWKTFHPYRSFPSFQLNDANVRMVDLTGNGKADVLRTDANAFTYFPCLGEKGFSEPKFVRRTHNLDEFPDVYFSDPRIQLADMTGDGLKDIVMVHSGRIDYWPNLGYGRFGRRITMKNAPHFGPDFNPSRLFLADIDGDGPADLVYVEPGKVRFWFNQCGNGWSNENIINGTPSLKDIDSIQFADMFGNGCTGILWSSDFLRPGQSNYLFLDLNGGIKPYVLTEMRNNMGTTTRTTYKPSTFFYLEDLKRHKPWVSTIPFPVQVLAKVEVVDHVSKTALVTEYAYHHGYYDGRDREFRGFGMVEQWDTEGFAALSATSTFSDATNIDHAYHVPPVLTRTWFHTGAFINGIRISRQYEDEYYRESAINKDAHGLTSDQLRAMLLDDTILPGTIRRTDGTQAPYKLTTEEVREAHRALRGSILRQEIYALDGTDKEEHPYTVSERNYTIELLQPQAKNSYAVFFSHPLEAVNFSYERKLIDIGGKKLADPRVSHSMTLEVDRFGNVERSVSISYPRRSVPERKDRQSETHMTFTVNRFINRDDQQDWYRAGIPAESQTYEVVKPPEAVTTAELVSLFKFRCIQTLIENLFPSNQTQPDSSKILPYEEWNWRNNVGMPAVPKLRLIEHVRTLYRKNDLTGPLALGQAESLLLPFESYKLAFTPGLLKNTFVDTGKIAAGDLANVLRNEGMYQDLDANGYWWIPSGQVFYSQSTSDTPALELANAKEHFFLPHRFRDPFHNTTTVRYDAYDMLLVETKDPLGSIVTVETKDIQGNVIKVENDYRVMQPALVYDPNGNRSAVAFNALGMVVGTAVMGKAGENLGDSLAGFETDLTEEQAEGFFAVDNPHIHAPDLLKDATTRIIYDLFQFLRTQKLHPAEPEKWQPVYAATLARETHVNDPLPQDGLKIQISFSYSDGFGREIQKKIQAEPRSLVEGGPNVSPRWVGNGWTIFNNKGKPVKKYEPFFSATHDFEFAKQVGISSTLFYDPVERVVATLHPNHTYEKVVFDPWQQETWDVNDTVTLYPRTDENVKGFFINPEGTSRLATNDYLPTWYTLRTDPAHAVEANQKWPDPKIRNAEKNAAEKTSVYAQTPAVAYFDTLGRAFLSVAHNKFDRQGTIVEEKYTTRIEFDIEGNQRVVNDTLGRKVMVYDYDMLSTVIYQNSMDAGERWMLNNVAGKPIRKWDSRNHEFIFTYDELQRPTEMGVRGGDGQAPLDTVYEKIIYGENKSLNGRTDKELNLRVKPFEHYDTGGKVQFETYDFKGNVLKNHRRLATDYKNVVHWGVTDTDALLETESFITETKYDALNRVIESKTPDGSITFPAYNEANLLEAIRVTQGDTTTEFVKNINYNEKGQRKDITYGNGIVTMYDYDRETFRLSRLETKRANGTLLQDLSYTYDPVGNTAQIEDRARPTIFFNNFETEPVNTFIYDAIYRLIEAHGREHIAQVDYGGEDNWHDQPFLKQYSARDPMPWRNYTQRYRYDGVGNITMMEHIANSGSWTRDYQYETINNRLKSTTVGSDTYPYPHHLQHGFITGMPHLHIMRWNFRDELQAVAREVRSDGGTPETTYYVYDAAGQRIRKVTENNAASGVTPTKKNERIYVGGVEIYKEYTGSHAGLQRKTLRVMDDKYRIAMVEMRNSVDDGSPARLIRYQFSNHLGTACLETDDNARVISYEEYHSYGTTSYQAVDKDIKATAKRYRYTGKERDEESGLYYHGARYYVPWLGRWVSCDPASPNVGLNLYEYVGSSPTKYTDPNGKGLLDWVQEQLDQRHDYWEDWAQYSYEHGNYLWFAYYKLERYCGDVIQFLTPTTEDYVASLSIPQFGGPLLSPLGGMTRRTMASRPVSAVTKFVERQMGKMEALLNRKANVIEQKVLLETEQKAEPFVQRGAESMVKHESGFSQPEILETIVEEQKRGVRAELPEGTNKVTTTLKPRLSASEPSEVLAKKMIDSGIPFPGEGFEAHHMIPEGDPRAEWVKNMFDEADLSLNEAYNGIWLPRGKDVVNPEGVLRHEFTFGDDYFQLIEEHFGKFRDMIPDPNELVNELWLLREDISQAINTKAFNK